MKPGKVTTPVILGQPWQRAYNGIPNWRREGITFEKGGIRYFLPFINEDCYTSDDESDKEGQAGETTPPTDIQEVCKPQSLHEPQLQNKAPQQARTKPQTIQGSEAVWVPKKLRQAQEGHAQIWIPKTSKTQHTAGKQSTSKRPRAPPTTNKRKNKNPKANQKRNHARANPQKIHSKAQIQRTNTQQRWVPKTLLRAQGYYEGAEHVWLIKPLHTTPRTIKKVAPVTQPRATKKAYKYEPNKIERPFGSKTQHRWIPKVTLQAQGYYDGASKVWLPKNKRVGQPTQGQTQPKWVWQRKDHNKEKINLIPGNKNATTHAKGQNNNVCNQQQKSSPKTTPQTHKATWLQKGKWVPKQQGQGIATLTDNCLASTSAVEPSRLHPDKATAPPVNPQSIRERALLLQNLLFGSKSTPSTTKKR